MGSQPSSSNESNKTTACDETKCDDNQQFDDLVGKRLDAYDKKSGKWWPATIIDFTYSHFKIQYDGDSSNTQIFYGNDYTGKIAPIHKHTKHHQIHKQLMDESERRKKEWNKNANPTHDFRSIYSSSNIDCPYFKLSSLLLAKAVLTSDISAAMFDKKGDRCFCQVCHKRRGDAETYSRGKPSQTYVIPIGYSRFGIKLPLSQKENILDLWHVVYHGTKSKYLNGISESGLILLKPNDFILNTKHKYAKKEIQSKHIQTKFKRTNKHSNKIEIFDPEQIFTSPSCIYASKYCDSIDINNSKVSFMFQCRQKPGTYSIGQETMGFNNTAIDKWVRNESIEFYTKENLNIIITGILVKINNFEPNVKKLKLKTYCGDCGGSGIYRQVKCDACCGSGTYRSNVECYKCDGSGWYTNQRRCFGCNGTGVYRRIAVECRKCVGSSIFRISCRKCNGTGISAH